MEIEKLKLKLRNYGHTIKIETITQIRKLGGHCNFVDVAVKKE
jgi:hypothetical protein